MTTQPVTGDIDARLKEIWQRHNMSCIPAQPGSREEAWIMDMVRAAYALDRASGDGVRVTDDTIEKACAAYWDAQHHSTWDLILHDPVGRAIKESCRKYMRAALSAVSIPGEFACPTLFTTETEALLTRMNELHLKYRDQNGSIFGWAISEIVEWRASARRWQAEAEKQPAISIPRGEVARPCRVHKGDPKDPCQQCGRTNWSHVDDPLPPAGGWRDMDSAPTDRPFFAIRGYEDHWTMMGAFQRRITPLEHDKNVWAVSCDKNYWLRADVWQNGTVELDLWRWSEIPPLPAPPASDKETR